MLESYSCCKSEGGEVQSGKPDEAPTMVQEVSQDDGCGDAEKGGLSSRGLTVLDGQLIVNCFVLVVVCVLGE